MIEILNDLYDIANKIKQINPCYKIFRNEQKHRFEIHSKRGNNLVLELVLPFDKLDYRTVNLVNKTKIENADALFEEIEKTNNKLSGGC